MSVMHRTFYSVQYDVSCVDLSKKKSFIVSKRGRDVSFSSDYGHIVMMMMMMIIIIVVSNNVVSCRKEP